MENLLSTHTHCHDPLQEQVQEVVIELHQFFEGWLGGVLEKNYAHEQYLDSQFTSDFTMILPQGIIQGRHEAVEGLKKAWGAVPNLKITITDVQVIFEDATVVMAVYKEEQLIQNIRNARVSSVLFQKEKGKLRWRFVQETFVASTAD